MEGRGTVPNCTNRRRTIPKKAVSILRTIPICIVDLLRGGLAVMNCTKSRRTVPKNGKCTNKWTYWSLTGHGAELARLKSFRAIGRLFFSGFPALYPCCCPGSHLFRFEEGTSYHPNTSPRFWTAAVRCHLVLQAVRQGSHPVLIYKGIFLLSRFIPYNLL